VTENHGVGGSIPPLGTKKSTTYTLTHRVVRHFLGDVRHLCSPFAPEWVESGEHVLHAASCVSLGVMDRHRQRLLAEPSPNRVDIAAGFDKNRSDSMP
jgi:hypothetical protein